MPVVIQSLMCVVIYLLLLFLLVIIVIYELLLFLFVVVPSSLTCDSTLDLHVYIFCYY